MLWCLGLKILGAMLSWTLPLSLWAQALAVGALPIWLEILASTLSQTEPSRETRRHYLYADALVDAAVFIFSPAYFFWISFQPLEIPVRISLTIFIMAGLYRLIRFLQRGLVGGKFSGLPVTYTGYAWLPAAFLIRAGFPSTAGTLFLLLAWAMLTPRLKLNPSR